MGLLKGFMDFNKKLWNTPVGYQREEYDDGNVSVRAFIGESRFWYDSTPLPNPNNRRELKHINVEVIDMKERKRIQMEKGMKFLEMRR